MGGSAADQREQHDGRFPGHDGVRRPLVHPEPEPRSGVVRPVPHPQVEPARDDLDDRRTGGRVLGEASPSSNPKTETFSVSSRWMTFETTAPRCTWTTVARSSIAV
jgi:hypothetical protein